MFYNYNYNYKYCLQEVREMRSRYESRLVEVDSGRQKEFESKLAEAMQQLRQEHECQIQQYKDDLERTFNAKVHNQGIFPHLKLVVGACNTDTDTEFYTFRHVHINLINYVSSVETHLHKQRRHDDE